MISDRHWRALVPGVLRALAGSDAVILKSLGRTRVRYKSDGSEVTAADRAAERVLRVHLAAVWPYDARVSGEELGGAIPARGWCWLVDPIDGTASFSLGLPTFGTLVALVHDREPVFGCIHLPALGETTWATTGRGCWFRRAGSRTRRVRVRESPSLARATVSLTGLHCTDLARNPGAWQVSNVLKRAGRVRFVGDCLQYALLCRGLLDAAIDPAMKPWDIAALVPCVREAGGVIGSIGTRVRPLILADSLVAAGSPALLRSIRRLTRGLRPRPLSA